MSAVAELLKNVDLDFQGRLKAGANGKLEIVNTNVNTAEIDYIEEHGTKVGLFKNIDSKGKIEARQIIAKWVKTHIMTKSQVLTLPYVTWDMEKLIQLWTGKIFSYMACERDYTIFKGMLENGQKYGKNNDFFYGTLGDKINVATENQYSHLILDYCGMLTTFHKEITKAVINNIVEVGGTISVTVLKARDSSHIISKCYDSSPKEMTTKTGNAIREFFVSLCNISDFEVVEELEYKGGDKHSSPMMLTVLKRTK
jgi:hypothetical protein